MRLPFATAGVASVISLSGLVCRISNSGPALTTNVSPSSLSRNIRSLYAHGDAVNPLPISSRPPAVDLVAGTRVVGDEEPPVEQRVVLIAVDQGRRVVGAQQRIGQATSSDDA